MLSEHFFFLCALSLSPTMDAGGPYIPGWMMDQEVNMTKTMMVYMLGTQAMVLIGDRLFEGVWNATWNRWTAGKPVAAAEEVTTLAIWKQPGSPGSTFDYDALEIAESNNNNCPAGSGSGEGERESESRWGPNEWRPLPPAILGTAW